MARRDSGDGGALDPALTQKKRARRRLVGALVLGVLAAVVLPMILDSEPRQTITDVQIEIPPRDTPLPPKADDAGAPSAQAPAVPPVPAPAPADDAPRDVATAGKEASAAAPVASSPKPVEGSKPAEPSKPATAAKKPPAPAEAPRASAPAASTETTVAKPDARFAVQLGAFANAGSARAQADKARKAGVRVYTETVQTAQGPRTRVRAGPFATREAADQARARLKLIGLDSSVVTL